MFEHRPLISSDLTSFNFPLECWSDEPKGMEKRVILNRVIKAPTNCPTFIEYKVRMFDADNKSNITATLSKGYMEKFYFIKKLKESV